MIKFFAGALAFLLVSMTFAQSGGDIVVRPPRGGDRQYGGSLAAEKFYLPVHIPLMTFPFDMNEQGFTDVDVAKSFREKLSAVLAERGLNPVVGNNQAKRLAWQIFHGEELPEEKWNKEDFDSGLTPPTILLPGFVTFVAQIEGQQGYIDLGRFRGDLGQRKVKLFVSYTATAKSLDGQTVRNMGIAPPPVLLEGQVGKNIFVRFEEGRNLFGFIPISQDLEFGYSQSRSGRVPEILEKALKLLAIRTADRIEQTYPG